VTPPCLHDGHLRIDEVMDCLMQELARGDEVSIKDGDELAFGDLQSGLEGAGLVAGAILPVQIADVESLRHGPPDCQLGN
jgi:hypothetical protein